MEKNIDLRVYKTYKALHEAFIQLLEQKSFEELTVNELCEKATIRRATFYKHFEDKYDYFNFFLSELREELKEKVTAQNNTMNTTDYSLQLLREVFQFIHRHEGVWNRLEGSRQMSFLYQALETQISLELYDILVRTGQKIPSPELDLLTAFYAGGLINIIRWWFTHPNKIDEKEIAEKLAGTMAYLHSGSFGEKQ